jgi:hypothetical protein
MPDAVCLTIQLKLEEPCYQITNSEHYKVHHILRWNRYIIAGISYIIHT